MHILIAPGAFKESLGAGQATDAIARGLREALPDATLTRLPIADGGNGTLDAWLAQGGTRHTMAVRDPLGREIDADFGILPDGKTAVIEMALASGLELLTDEERDPLETSTYGTGQLLRAALDAGARRFVIGMGGSATVDGGTGALAALGVVFRDAADAVITPCGGNLSAIATIDVSGLDERWQDCEIVIASDVDNPLLGERGAAAVFAPQKGASVADVQALEAGLAHFFERVQEQVKPDLRDQAGFGAAGALSFGLMSFLGGRIESGIDLLLERNHFEQHLAVADWVITGEGQIDEQTIGGKGPIGVARIAHQAGVPVIALVGGLNVDDRLLHAEGVTAAFSIVPHPMALDVALRDADTLLERAALRVGYLLARIR